MRIWDLPAGYLNRQSLLGEHRELHGIYIILSEGKAGYARHPETRRWQGALSGLARRHALLAAEMRLRGYADRSPVLDASTVTWPTTFVTEPGEQVALLRRKYLGREPGRIPLPRNAQQLWAQHKYSVLARSPVLHRRFGQAMARPRSRVPIADVLCDLVLILREPPTSGGVVTAIEHMWGHVRTRATADERQQAKTGASEMLAVTQTVALRLREPYLTSSTALSELDAFSGGGSSTRALTARDL